MEILLLALLGGLTVGIGLWAALGDKKDGTDQSLRGRGGPVSSPELPSAGDSDDGLLDDQKNIGQSVVIGDPRKSAKLSKTDVVNRLLETPGPIDAKVVAPEKESRKRKEGSQGRALKVTYSTDDIISRSSRFSHHRRALGTADSLVAHEKAQEALNVYQRTNKRINDSEINEKIDKNIDDIKKWLSQADLEDESPYFPEIIIPLTTQAIALENLNEGLKSISENLLDRINDVLTRIRHQEVSAPVQQAAQTTQAPVSLATESPAVAPPTDISPVTTPAQLSSPVSPRAYTAPGISISPESLPAITEMLALKLFDKMDVEQPARDHLPEGFVLDENGNLITDGWTDADFDKEWEKYKNLPLKDRRSGKERRVGIDRRRLNEAKRKDRRSGIERRKRDLFKERDDFIKKLEKHKKRKKELEDWKDKQSRPQQKPEDLMIPAAALLDKKPPEPEAAPIQKPKEQEPEKKEPEPKKEEPKEEKPPEPVETTTRILPPKLKTIGMPDATEPYIEPVPMVSSSAETEEAAPEEKPASPTEGALSDGVEEVGDIPELGFSEPGDDEMEGDSEKEKPAPQEIHGVLELKPPEEDDAPFLTLTYDFAKIPDSFKLSADYHTMEFAYYKYKPMLIKAQEFTRRKMLKNALNYYRVIKSQRIPVEFKRMINRNIKDITEYLEKFLMSRG